MGECYALGDGSDTGAQYHYIIVALLQDNWLTGCRLSRLTQRYST